MPSIPSKIDEDQYRDEINRQIRDYFKKLGFEVIDVPSTRREKKAGYDVLFGNGSKIFGLQYKRPEGNSGIYWDIEKEQYKKIQKNCHIFYCLPDFLERNKLPTALYHILLSKLRGLKNRFRNQQSIRIRKGKFIAERWGSFARNIELCKYGRKIRDKDRDKIFNLIKSVKEKHVSLFSINIDKKIFVVLNKSILYEYF
jgi:hypothetical protein